MLPVWRLAANGLDAWAQVVGNGCEGLVAKDETSVYEGGPTRRWLKVKQRTGRSKATAGASVRHSLISRTAGGCGRLPAVGLLTERDAFFTDHHHCGDLDAGVNWAVVWITCPCGASMARLANEDDRADGG